MKMKLQEYLAKNKITQSEMAKKIGVTQGFISQCVLGVVQIPAFRAIQIERATNGEVSIDELITIPQTQQSA